MSTAIMKQGDVVQMERPFFTQEQEEMIRKSFLNGASAQEAAVLMEVAKLRKLNPITKQVHFVKRGGVWSVQVGIDGMRSIAERSGKYGGQDEPVYEDNRDGSIKLCKVAVYRKDWDRPAVGVAYFTEYAQQSQIWKQYPRVMIAKCAEALALRKAFPEDLSGIYEPSEIGDDGPKEPKPSVREVAAAKAAQVTKRELPPQEAEVIEHDSSTGEVVEDGPPSEADHRETTTEADLSVQVPAGKLKGKPVAELTPKSARWYLENGPYRDTAFLSACEARAAQE